VSLLHVSRLFRQHLEQCTACLGKNCLCLGDLLSGPTCGYRDSGTSE